MSIIAFRRFSILILSVLLLITIIVASMVLDERVLYLSAASLFIVELFAISKYRFDILLYCGLLIFIFSQFSFTVFDVSRWIFLLLGCILAIFIIGSKKFKIGNVAIGFGLLSFYSIITSFFSYYPAISLLKGISILLFSIFLALVIPTVQILYPDLGVRKYFLRMFLSFAIVIVVTNAVYFLIFPNQSILAERFRGWFQNPNGIGAVYGIFFVPILANEYFETKKGSIKAYYLVVLMLAIIELIASQSRAGILAGITSLGILTLWNKKLQLRIILILASVLFFTAIIVSNPSNNIVRQFIYRDEVTLEGNGRLPVWIATWNRFLAHPIFGSGLGVSDTGLNSVGMASSTGKYTIEKGNSYLGMVEELGIVGSLIIFVTLFMPLFNSIIKNLTFSFNNETNLVMTSIVAAGFINAMFEAWLFSVGSLPCYCFWIFAAILNLQRPQAEHKEPSLVSS